MFTKGTLSACYGAWTPVLGAEVLNLGPRVGFGPAGRERGHVQSRFGETVAIYPLVSVNP